VCGAENVAGSSIWGTRTTQIQSAESVARALLVHTIDLGGWVHGHVTSVHTHPIHLDVILSRSSQGWLPVCARLNISITCPAASLRGLIIYRLGAAEFSARIAPEAHSRPTLSWSGLQSGRVLFANAGRRARER